MEVGLVPDDFVLDGEPATHRKKAHHPTQKNLALVYCGQTAGWIKMPLGTEVNLGPGDVVLDGVAAPQFSVRVYCGQTAGWMKTPLGTVLDLGPGHFVLDGFPAIGERGTAAHSFRPMPTVATVAHLSCC